MGKGNGGALLQQLSLSLSACMYFESSFLFACPASAIFHSFLIALDTTCFFCFTSYLSFSLSALIGNFHGFIYKIDFPIQFDSVMLRSFSLEL